MSLYGMSAYARWLRGEATEEDLRVLHRSERMHLEKGIACVAAVLVFVGLLLVAAFVA